MNRRQSREQAFVLLFESTFGFTSSEEIIENAQLAREVKLSKFTKNIFNGVIQKVNEIDNAITKNLKGWNKTRISKTALALLRMATYEILFENDTPDSVAVNEAVELAKEYSSVEEAAYINGVLGGIINSKEDTNKSKEE